MWLQAALHLWLIASRQLSEVDVISQCSVQPPPFSEPYYFFSIWPWHSENTACWYNSKAITSSMWPFPCPIHVTMAIRLLDAECLPAAGFGPAGLKTDICLLFLNPGRVCMQSVFPQPFFGILLSLGLMARSQAHWMLCIAPFQNTNRLGN